MVLGFVFQWALLFLESWIKIPFHDWYNRDEENCFKTALNKEQIISWESKIQD